MSNDCLNVKVIKNDCKLYKKRLSIATKYEDEQLL